MPDIFKLHLSAIKLRTVITMTKESSDEEVSANMLKCSYCSKEFKYNSERNRHELSHSPRFECAVCCKKFSFVSALRRHQKQHERSGSVKCQECNKKFRDEVLLKRHIKYAHRGTFTCSKCSGQFSSDQALQTHMKTHKPISERRFKCNFGCGKSFNFSHHLKHHELTHTNEKQHYCSICGKGFIQSHHLKTHLKTHDPSEWLYCDVPGCKKKFSTEYAKKRHIATHKSRPDSGISSDSSSCDTSVSFKDGVPDSILCASCGESVLQTDYSKHSIKCGDSFDICNKVKSINIPIKQDNVSEMSIHTSKHMFDKYLGDCRTAVGDCMNANNCMCAQMSKPVDDNYDFSPFADSNSVTVENNNNLELGYKYQESCNDSNGKEAETTVSSLEYNADKSVLKEVSPVFETTDKISSVDTYFSYNKNSISNMCEGCECARSCNRDLSNCNFNGSQNIFSNVKCTDDGVIKLKDTFDIDIPMKVKSEAVEKSQPFIPFGTCRDVIGNCIAEGNEGCLCARMTMDERQAMAQEIEDITPKPKTEFPNLL